MSTYLKLSLFGKPAVLISDAPVPSLGTTKAQALFYYLATTGAVHSRQELAYLLWPSNSDEKTKNSLRVALASLRKVLPDYLIIDRETVAFNHQTPHNIDVHRFDNYDTSLLNSPGKPDIDSLQQVAELYKGTFLEDLHIDGAPEFEGWLLNERTNRQHIIERVFSLAADALLTQRRYEEAKTILRRHLELAPWQEEIHVQLMETLSRLGDFNGALAQYRSCVSSLADELDAEPMPETTALYERIQAARSVHRHNLPADPTPFVGRNEELALLHDLLTSPDCRLVTITGLGGIGKTRLALSAARQICQEEALLFINGVIYIPMASIRSGPLFPSSLAERLGLKLSSRDEPLTAVMDYLENKEVLLVLDGFEALVRESRKLQSQNREVGPTISEESAIDTLGLILEDCPDVRCLITSREPLGLSGERKVEIHGLDYPAAGENLNNEDIERFSTVQLFLQSATQVRPGYKLTDDERLHVVELCRLLGGMPLGIKLAAAWLRAMSTQRVVQEISHNLDFLTTRMRDVAPQQRSMRVVLDYTWELLSEEERMGFASLSVFAGSFDMEAAQTITGITTSTLNGIAGRSLVQVGQSSEELTYDPYTEYKPTVEARANGSSQKSGNDSESRRYTIHQLVRQYGAAKLAQMADVHERLIAAHSAYYVAFLEDKIALFSSLDELSALNAIALESENIRAVWNRSVRDFDPASLKSILDGISLYFRRAGPFQEAEAVCRVSIDQIRNRIHSGHLNGEEAQPVLGKILVEQSRFLTLLGNFDTAVDVATEALEISKKLDLTDVRSDELSVEALYAHSRALFFEGDLDTAFEDFHDCLELAKEASMPTYELYCYNMIGLVQLRRNQYVAAENAFIQGLEIAAAIRDRATESVLLNNLGVIMVQQGNYAEAQEYYERALNLNVEIGNRADEGLCLNNLGRIYSEQRRYTTAGTHLDHALVLALELGDKRIKSNTLLSMGRNALYMGNYETAARLLEESLEIKLEMKEAHGEAELPTYQGLLLHLQGDNQGAIERVQIGLAKAQQANSVFVLYFAQTNLGHILTALDRLDEAKEAYISAHNGRVSCGHQHLSTEPLAGLIDIAIRNDDVTSLTEHSEALLSYLEDGEVHGADQPFRVYWMAYQALLQTKPESASLFLKSMKQKFAEAMTEIKDPEGQKSFVRNVAVHRAIWELEDSASE